MTTGGPRQETYPDLRIWVSAPTATRTRDLLLRRRFHSMVRCCPVWSDMVVTWPFARLTRLDVAWTMGLLAISLAISETMTKHLPGG
jgi:hypothetical protein